MPGHIRRNLLIFLALLIAPAAVGALHWLLPAGELKDAAGIVQAVLTAMAIIGGGLVAAYKLQLFRDFAPHLTITHEVSHRPVGDSYVHIAVKAALHNGSRVKVELRDGFFLLQQIAPVSDPEVEALYDAVFVDRDDADFQWPTLDEVERRWERDECVVEPGEMHQELCEFLVKSDIKTALLYTFFTNSEYPKSSQTQGWDAATVYDIIVGE